MSDNDSKCIATKNASKIMNIIELKLSDCPFLSKAVNVSLSATNQLGRGPTSDDKSFGMLIFQNCVTKHYQYIASLSISCKYLRLQIVSNKVSIIILLMHLSTCPVYIAFSSSHAGK